METDNLILIVIGIVAAIVYAFFHFSGNGRKSKAKTERKKRRDWGYSDATLKDDKLKILALGAVMDEVNEWDHFEFSLPDEPNESCMTVLSDYWGVENKSDTIETLERLLSRGFRYYSTEVFHGLSMSDEDYTRYIESKYGDEEDVSSFFSQRSNLLDSMDMLKKEGIITSEEDLKRLGTASWDAGRSVNVARMALESEYIGEALFWEYATRAMELTRKHYDNWKDYGKSYVIGRSMWAGPQSGMQIVGVVRSLGEEDGAPWEMLDLK